MRAHLFRRVRLDQFSVFHDCDHIPQLEGFINVVRDENDGFFQFALNLQQFKLHVLAYQRIKGGEGLIHQKHVRVIGKGAGDAYALPHTAGEACAGLALPAVEPYHRDNFHGLFFPMRFWNAFNLQPISHIAEHVPVAHKAEGLEDHGDFFPAECKEFFFRKVCKILSFKKDMSIGRLI